MLKSWVISPFQSANDATIKHAKMPYTERTTVAPSSGRFCQRPEKERSTHQRPRMKAAQSANCPSSVMKGSSGLGNGLVAGTAFGEHIGGANDPVPTQTAFDDHLDIRGVGKCIGNQPMVGDRVGLDPIGDLKVDPAGIGIPA